MLRLLVMSATLGGNVAERCAALLGSDDSESDGEDVPSPAPLLISEGRSYPVDIRWVNGVKDRNEAAVDGYEQNAQNECCPVFFPGNTCGCRYCGSPAAGRGELEKVVARTVVKALENDDGDLLVFLPGWYPFPLARDALSDTSTPSIPVPHPHPHT